MSGFSFVVTIIFAVACILSSSGANSLKIDCTNKSTAQPVIIDAFNNEQTGPKTKGMKVRTCYALSCNTNYVDCPMKLMGGEHLLLIDDNIQFIVFFNEDTFKEEEYWPTNGTFITNSVVKLPIEEPRRRNSSRKTFFH